ncbi:MAG: amidohydrolase family protein, partial [Steroidobacteraceae bacterium]
HGLTGFTHLFNAMSQLTGREPGAVGAALEDANSWCGIIVDGHHVHPAVLRVAVRSKRRDRFMLVTDAMPSVGAPNKSFNLQGRPISVADNMCVDEDGRLAGSDIDMATAVRNAPEMLGIDLERSARMASEYPAQFLGLERELGRIAPGHRANLVLVDRDVRVIETWIDGQAQPGG